MKRTENLLGFNARIIPEMPPIPPDRLEKLLGVRDPGSTTKCDNPAYKDADQKLFSCFGILHRIKDKQIEFLSVRYRAKKIVSGILTRPMQIKFPGGGSEKGETPFDTVIREIVEETQLPNQVFIDVTLTPLKNSGIYVIPSGKREPVNHKIYFMVNEPVNAEVDVSIVSNDPEIEGVAWISAEEAAKKSYGFHRLALKECAEILQMRPEYAWLLMGLDFTSHQEVTE